MLLSYPFPCSGQPRNRPKICALAKKQRVFSCKLKKRPLNYEITFTDPQEAKGTRRMKKEEQITGYDYEPLAVGREKVKVERQLQWYRLIHQARLLDDRARNYIRQAKGWSYHASHAGHDGIQLALGLAFRA